MSIGLTSTIVYGQETYTTDEIEELSQQGSYFYNSGNYKQALEIFEELLVLHTNLEDDVGIEAVEIAIERINQHNPSEIINNSEKIYSNREHTTRINYT